MRSQPAEKISKMFVRHDARKTKIDHGQGAIASYLSKYIHPSLWVRNHHLNIGKGHQLEGMTVLRRELKKIRGKEVMAIVVTAPGTVDDADTTELYALEKHFKIIFEGDSDYFYYGEGDLVPEEAVADEEMPSELFELVERTGTIYDADDVALAAVFVAIDDENAPAPENVVHPNELINNLFEDE